MYKMMIVDDESIVVEGIKDTIPWGDYNVSVGATAGDGLEALEKLSIYQPDIIIVDIRMPGMGGLEFIENAKDVLPKVKIIVISAFEHFSYAQRAIELGVSCYLVKPIQKTAIITKVKSCIDEINAANTDKDSTQITIDVNQIESSGNSSVNISGNEPKNYAIREACRYIGSHAYKDISLVETAEHVALTPTYLSAMFKQEMGISFIEYVKNIRMEKAKEMLLNTNKKTYEICLELGYKSVQYFTTLFRETSGMTPKEYREKNRS